MKIIVNDCTAKWRLKTASPESQGNNIICQVRGGFHTSAVTCLLGILIFHVSAINSKRWVVWEDNGGIWQLSLHSFYEGLYPLSTCLSTIQRLDQNGIVLSGYMNRIVRKVLLLKAGIALLGKVMKFINKLIYRWIEEKFMHGCSDYNTLFVRKQSRSKRQAREAFAQYDIPHARGTIFYNPFTALRFVRQHGFPVVIKPNVSGYSRGSHFPITNYREFWKAVLLVKVWWPSTVIEEYLLGKNYRVVVLKNEIMSVIRRYPPFVTGDGESTVERLIDVENSRRKEMGLYPVMHAISKGRATNRFLKKRQLSLFSIPGAKEVVYLGNKVALAPGGIVEIIDKSSISEKNRELFFRILKAFDANIFGIDVIFEKGIETDFDSQMCIFLELNSRPFLEMHKFPRMGKKQDLNPYFAKLNAIQLGDSGVF